MTKSWCLPSLGIVHCDGITDRQVLSEPPESPMTHVCVAGYVKSSDGTLAMSIMVPLDFVAMQR